MSQLALPLRLADHAVFGSFLDRGNEALVALLRDLAAGRAETGCWMWGGAAAGKSHLLQAVCDRAGDQSVYVPLDSLSDAAPEILEGLASRELICLDDIDAVAGDAAWEHALFRLSNDILEAGGRLLVAAKTAPRAARFTLPDLASRLSRLPVFRIAALGDADRAAALKLRARHRGLELPDETAAYLLNHSRRDMTSLYELLDKLDAESLRVQRRLTIPFAKQVMKNL